MKKKGFTLIELLAVIIILAIIALITVPVIMNIIEKVRKGAAEDSTYNYIKAVENEIALSNLENKVYKDGNDYTLDDIKVEMKGSSPTGGLYTLKNGNVESGTFCVNNYTVNYQNSKAKAETSGCNKDNIKKQGSIKLSSNSGNYKYPNNGTFEVVENISGGSLSCKSSDETIAECSISGNIVTVTPKNKEGTTTLIIKSSETSSYTEATASHVVITAESLFSVTANGYEGVYDGQPHGITVVSEGTTIKYGTKTGTYDLNESPTYADVGTYTVYYQVSKEGYKTVTSSKDVIITKAEGNIILSETSGNYTYPTSGTFTITENKSNGTLNCTSSDNSVATCSINNNTVTVTPGTKEGSAILTITSQGNNNYKEAQVSYVAMTTQGLLSVTANGYTGVYDGSSHGISVLSSGATIKYGTVEGTYNLDSSPTYTNAGTYTVYYQITKEGYKTIKGNKTVTISKADGKVTLSETSGSYTYPTSGTFKITENKSGGTLSCTSSDESVATCSISGTTVTVTPKTKEGSATLTIKSTATTNYKEAQASYVATTEQGILSVTANGYTGTYDGASHGIIVTSSGATIKYGTSEGTYNLTSSPTYTNTGTYTVYYQVTKEGYKTVTGSKNIVINKANGSVSLSATSGIVYTGKSITFTASNSTGTLSCTSSNTSVATCSISGTTVTVNGVASGTSTITVNVASSTNNNAASKIYSATVRQSVTSISLDKTSVELYPTDTINITATVSPSTAYNKTLKWTSDNTTIATVSNGVITGVKAGTTKIKATTTDGSNITKEVTVKVSGYANGILKSQNNCINTGTCSNGTLVNVQVNSSENYNFYVINDTGSELKLIMDRNLGNQDVYWIVYPDYVEAGGTNWDSNHYYADVGPRTALKELESRTSNWTNIKAYDYTLVDEADPYQGKILYQPIKRTNVRARMLTYAEANTLGCTKSSNSCSTYLYDNLDSSQRYYWLSASASMEGNQNALVMYYTGRLDFTTAPSKGGIRPVIKVPKK